MFFVFYTGRLAWRQDTCDTWRSFETVFFDWWFDRRLFVAPPILDYYSTKCCRKSIEEAVGVALFCCSKPKSFQPVLTPLHSWLDRANRFSSPEAESVFCRAGTSHPLRVANPPQKVLRASRQCLVAGLAQVRRRRTLTQPLIPWILRQKSRHSSDRPSGPSDKLLTCAHGHG